MQTGFLFSTKHSFKSQNTCFKNRSHQTSQVFATCFSGHWVGPWVLFLGLVAVLLIPDVSQAGPKSLKRISKSERADIMRVASGWKQGWNTRELDLKQGGEDNPPFQFNEKVTCKFQMPESLLEEERTKVLKKGEILTEAELLLRARPGGKTHKFQCLMDRDGDGREESYRVKYSEPSIKGRLANMGIIGEIFGTRLAWALGFYADRVYPVQIKCENCPRRFKFFSHRQVKGPWDYYEDFFDKAERVPDGYRFRTREFEFAVIEIKAKGKKVSWKTKSGKEKKGFTFLEALNDRYLSKDPEKKAIQLRDRYAMILFSAFIQHADNKDMQQRLMCPKKLRYRKGGKVRCSFSQMYIQDFGVSFGGGATGTIFNKVDIDQWLAQPIFQDPKKCIVHINNYPSKVERGYRGLINMPISEAGRRHFTDLINKLTDEQIYDLFDRIPEQVGKYIPTRKSRDPANWLAAFKTRRQQLNEAGPCPPVDRSLLPRR